MSESDLAISAKGRQQVGILFARVCALTVPPNSNLHHQRLNRALLRVCPHSTMASRPTVNVRSAVGGMC